MASARRVVASGAWSSAWSSGTWITASVNLVRPWILGARISQAFRLAARVHTVLGGDRRLGLLRLGHHQSKSIFHFLHCLMKH